MRRSHVGLIALFMGAALLGLAVGYRLGQPKPVTPTMQLLNLFARGQMAAAGATTLTATSGKD